MKFTKQFLTAAMALVLTLTFGQAEAHNRNDVLFYQSINDGYFNVVDEVYLTFFEDWRASGVRKVRTQAGEDKAGTYRNITELNLRGDVARVEGEDGRTYTVAYDKHGKIRRIRTYQLGKQISTEHFYYNREGDLKKSTLQEENGDREFERFYDSNYRLVRQRKYEGGYPVKTISFDWTYDADGRVLSMKGPGRNVKCFYDGGKLIQVRSSQAGRIEQANLSYGDHGLATIKIYEEKEGDLIRAQTLAVEYNNAGYVARLKKQGRDRKATAAVTNYFYDSFSETALATRGDWDGGGYGYGTPILIEWSRPEYDNLVTEPTQVMQLKLSPGINQEMPDIKTMTLRLNHGDTENEIGEVVLRKVGDSDEWFVEETLPLMEGQNTVFLEVETEYGRFTSGERYITFKDPNKQITVRNLHILAIGIEDYAADNLDLDHAGDDVEALIGKLESQKGKLFNEVRTQTLSDTEATRQNIEDAVRKIRGAAAKDDLVLIYFAGHGEEMDGNFYLKPHDVAGSRSDLKETAIDNRWMLEEISRYNASTLYFMDASHDIKVDEEETVDIGGANMDEVKEDFENVIDSQEDIRIFMSSTSTKQKSQTSDAGTSVFATALLEGIEGKADASGNANGYVTVNELSDYVSDRVLGLTGWSQKPTAVKRGIGLVPIAKIQ